MSVQSFGAGEDDIEYADHFDKASIAVMIRTPLTWLWQNLEKSPKEAGLDRWFKEFANRYDYTLVFSFTDKEKEWKHGEPPMGSDGTTVVWEPFVRVRKGRSVLYITAPLTDVSTQKPAPPHSEKVETIVYSNHNLTTSHYYVSDDEETAHQEVLLALQNPVEYFENAIKPRCCKPIKYDPKNTLLLNEQNDEAIEEIFPKFIPPPDIRDLKFVIEHREPPPKEKPPPQCCHILNGKVTECKGTECTIEVSSITIEPWTKCPKPSP